MTKAIIGSAASKQIEAAENATQSVIASHPELFHYTGEPGLKGIVESNSFRATYFSDMNDAKEIRELQESLIFAMAARLTPVVERLRQSVPMDPVVERPGAPQHLARRWAEILYEVIFPREHESKALCFTTSFCSHSDDQHYERENGLLSQWRAYGNEGFCLVFDTAKLLSLFELERSAYLYSYTSLLKAHYPREDADILRSFAELLDTSEAALTAALAGDGQFSVDAVLRPFLDSAIATKHQGFYEERELRLVAMAVTEQGLASMAGVEGFVSKPIKEVFELARNGRTSRHISLFGKDYPVLPLLRVIVGPSARQADNAAIARKILGNGVRITRSATPFLG